MNMSLKSLTDGSQMIQDEDMESVLNRAAISQSSLSTTGGPKHFGLAPKRLHEDDSNSSNMDGDF